MSETPTTTAQPLVENLLQRCRHDPKWASEIIAILRKEKKALELEVIALKDDVRFANDLMKGEHAKQAGKDWKKL